MEHVLSEDNDAKLAEYLRYLRRKRDMGIAEVAAEFKEVRESRLFEDSYTAEDVESILDGLLSGARRSRRRLRRAPRYCVTPPRPTRAAAPPLRSCARHHAPRYANVHVLLRAAAETAL
jgi:hypothetical protein